MRTSFILFIILTSTLFTSAFAQVCPYQDALESFRNEQYQDAINDFTRIIDDAALCPDVNAEDAYYWRAWCYYKLNNLDNALADFRQSEPSPDNGATALYMRLQIEHSKNPNNIDLLQSSVGELNSLLARPNIPPSLQDRAMLYRNMLRLQIGEILYNDNELDLAKNYFQGILSDEEDISATTMSEINSLIKAAASAWLLHTTLQLDEDVEDSFVPDMLEIPLTISEAEPAKLEEYSNYYKTFLPLLGYLKLNDYDLFVRAREALPLLENDDRNIPVEDVRTTFNLLESEYNVVINNNITNSPFANYRMGWAYFLRNEQSNDASQAAKFFQTSKNALEQCQSELRKASAFRYLQAKHFTNCQADEFVKSTLAAYFSNECISDQLYIDHRDRWAAMYEEGYGFGRATCETSKGYLDYGLYRGSAAHVEKGKSQSSLCPGTQSALERAIYMCIGSSPNFQGAIDVLNSAVANAGNDADEINYALAMAHYELADDTHLRTAAGLLHDLARRGSLDACYKAANIYYALGDNNAAAQYLETIRQNPNMYTIYRSDANALYGLIGGSALGSSPLKLPAQSTVKLNYPEYQIFAYDYIGTGVGVTTKYALEMKEELVRILKPQVTLNLYDLKLLIPPTELTAYINLTVNTPLNGTPELTITLNDEPIDAEFKQDGNQFKYDSGPLDIGNFNIVVNHKGTFGWIYKNFISGRFTQTVSLDSAFALTKGNVPSQLKNVTSLSHAMFAGTDITTFSPQVVRHAGQVYKLPDNMGVVTSAVYVDGAFYCLIASDAEVVKLTLSPPDSITDELFIRGVYNSETDIEAYRDGLSNPLKIVFNPVSSTFYILNANGTIYELNQMGHCISAIAKNSDSSFFIDMLYEAGDNSLWLLDIGDNLIRKYDIDGKRYDRFARKVLDPTVTPLSFMADAGYFYLATHDGDLHLHKKGNFRRLAVFEMDDKDADAIYSNFSLIGNSIDSKKIIAIRKQSDPTKIWPDEMVKVLGTAFDGAFEVGN